jgi:7-cyano-7-deazaguanine synthase
VKSSSAKKIAVLVSGGVDSAILLEWACKRFPQVTPVYIRCGIKWEQAELYWLRRYLQNVKRMPLQPLRILDCPVTDLYRQHWSTVKHKKVPGLASPDQAVFLPGRNLLLLSKASVFCYLHGIGNVALGTLGVNPFLDGRKQFFSSFQKTFSTAFGIGLKVWAPFATKRKSQILRLGRHLPLHLTFSCLHPRGLRPCQNCNKCAEWSKAMTRRRTPRSCK